jgi:hypothetical protein
MWTIRILKGPKTGEKFELQEGENIIGRAPGCHICINTPGLSKEHAVITVNENGVFIRDLNSTNGTFINGIKMHKQKLRLSDKVTLFDTIIGFEPKMSKSMIAPFAHGESVAVQFDPNFNNFPEQGFPQGVPPMQPQAQENFNPAQNMPMGKPTLLKMAKNYIDTVLLPGIYKLPELMELRWVIAGFIMAFILLVTSFSVIPMVSLTKSGVQRESQRRALSLAKSLADRYQVAYKEGLEASFNATSIEREEGVNTAYIISSADGVIIAPAKRAGQRPNEEFIHKARRQDQQQVEQLDDSTIGAAVPIKIFDSETGSFRVASHAIVLYDMGSLAVDTGRTIGLFIQVLAISMAIGALLFFFIYKLIEFPILRMNKQIDQGLKDSTTHAEVSYLFPPLQDLISNINTALGRAAQSTPNSAAPSDRTMEASQLVENYSGAAIAIDKSMAIISINLGFEELVGLRLSQVQGQRYESLNDQALILNLKDLLDQSQANGFNVITGQIEFNGRSNKIILQPIQADQGVSYYFITFQSIDQGGF